MNPVATKEQREEVRRLCVVGAHLGWQEGQTALDGLDIAEEMAEALDAVASTIEARGYPAHNSREMLRRWQEWAE